MRMGRKRETQARNEVRLLDENEVRLLSLLRGVAACAAGPLSQYRARMVYGAPLSKIKEDELGLAEVRRAGELVGDWAESSQMPTGFWRDVTVRCCRSGELHIKMVLQLPVEATGSRADDLVAFDTFAGWADERAAFVLAACRALPTLSGMSFQLAASGARPAKYEPCLPIFGQLRVLESHAGFSYLVGPETFSQVNPFAAEALVSRVAWWLGLGPPPPPHLCPGERSTDADATPPTSPVNCPAAVAAAAATAAVVSSACAVLVSGRDVNLFGPALFAQSHHTLHLVGMYIPHAAYHLYMPHGRAKCHMPHTLPTSIPMPMPCATLQGNHLHPTTANAHA